MTTASAAFGPLIAAMIPEAFRSSELPEKHVRWTFTSSIVSAMSKELSDLNIEELARFSPSAHVRFERGNGTHVACIPGDTAASLYRSGLPIVIDKHPALSRLAEAFAVALGVPTTGVSCNVFASLTGGKAPLHFDTAATIAFQLLGRKRW